MGGAQAAAPPQLTRTHAGERAVDAVVEVSGAPTGLVDVVVVVVGRVLAAAGVRWVEQLVALRAIGRPHVELLNLVGGVGGATDASRPDPEVVPPGGFGG